jgi:predicted outer membrane repeat protein
MANFIVTNLNNTGAGSLRDAVSKANANVDADVITFAVGGTITLTSELALTNDVTIDGDINGDDRADIVISGGNTTRIINQSGLSTDVQLLSLTLANGNATGPNPDGGAILVNYGSLLIGNTTLRNNVAGDDGGAIRTQGTALTIFNSVLHTNSAAHGGGLYVDGASTTIIANSTIHNNIASVNGGGVYIDGGSTLNLIQSTVTSNSADADNNGSGDGGGIFLFSATEHVNLTNTVVATNFDAAVSNDVRGTIDNSIHSVFGTAVTITNSINSLQNVGNPGLNSLSDRGGTVLTQNMIAESVLINAGGNGNVPSVDANGNPRIVAGTVDVGATEFQLVVTTSLDTVANDGFLSLREAVAMRTLVLM